MASRLIICLILIITFANVPTSIKANSKPNFIIIFADDQGYNDLGCYGAPLIRTPNIDELAAEGVRFTNFYAQPICGPSRAALMTGCYPLRIAEVGNIKRRHPMVHPDETLLPELLKKVGYKTACIGKWDLNGHRNDFQSDEIFPTNMGFDYWFGLPSSNDRGANNLYKNHEFIGKVPVDTITQLYTSEAIEFIEKSKDSPFLLYLAHTMPHTELGASSRFKGNSASGLYGDAIEEIDWSVGKIIEKLKELNLENNTLVVYTSDNGPWRARGTNAGSAFPLRSGKITTWEGGVRVPCIFWGPSFIEGNRVTKKVTSTMDILPTFSSLAGVQLPEDRKIDGQNIYSLLINSDQAKELKQIYFYYIETHLQALREGDWKLVLPRPQAPEWMHLGKKSIYKYEDTESVRDYELYNLNNDVGERRDVSSMYPEKVKELLQLVEQARKDIGDYNRIGRNARFFDEGEKRPEAIEWQKKEQEGWKQEIKVHPYYDSGARNL